MPPVVSGIGDADGALVGVGADGEFPVVVPTLAVGVGAAACCPSMRTARHA